MTSYRHGCVFVIHEMPRWLLDHKIAAQMPNCEKVAGLDWRWQDGC